jgi:hypothetical protein
MRTSFENYLFAALGSEGGTYAPPEYKGVRKRAMEKKKAEKKAAKRRKMTSGQALEKDQVL